ncbi:hypothetical protein HDV64DRAFT_81199 [Trichoderma sp. TUCIM 5745]
MLARRMSIGKACLRLWCRFRVFFPFLSLSSIFSQSTFSSFAKAVPGPMSVQKAKESYISQVAWRKTWYPVLLCFCSCHFSSLAASKKNGAC